MSPRLPVLLSVAALSLFGAACGDDQTETATAGESMQQSTPTATATPEPAPEASGDTIVDLAAGERRLATLVKAVTAADLASTLQGAGPFTVFAPTNRAFAALPKRTLKQLLAPAGKEQLTSILTYHVVEGAVMSSDLRDGQMVTTLQGEQLEVSIDGDQVRVGDATVVQPDVEASNGVVHVIDTVLQPAM